jgi:hypothetical protein
MPPRRRATPPPIDVDDLRSRLDQGKIVRVAIAHSAQFPSGSVGRVRRIGDPGIDGEEFIYVELTVNGMKDLLPFAPGDLAAPTKGASTARTGPARANGVAPGAAVGAAVSGAFGSSTGAAPRSPLGPPPPLPTTAPPQAVARAGSADPVRSPDPGSVAAPSGVACGPPPAPARPTPARPKVAPRSAAKRRGPAVAISIGTTEADPPQWRIEAKVGSKVVLRNGSVPPARVWELVGALGDETLTRAVGSVLDEQRQAAQSRADALAAELARVQAELADLPEPRDH